MAKKLVSYHHAVLAILIVGPMMMAARYFAVAAWAKPSGFAPFDTNPEFLVPYVLVGIGCVTWAVEYRSAWAHAYLGSASALMAMIRAVSIARNEEIPRGSAEHWVSVVSWGTVSIMSLLIAILGVQYVVEQRKRSEQ